MRMREMQAPPGFVRFATGASSCTKWSLVGQVCNCDKLV